MMPMWTRSLISGAAGAVTLTALHETARRFVPDAPRMDVLGMRALRRYVPALQHEPPRSTRLHRLALAGDLVANSIYYAAVAAPRAGETWSRAITLGTAAGAGALMLPQRMGLGDPPHSVSRANQTMTVAWYMLGAAAAACTANALRDPSRRRPDL
jgi:hypothetical protein